MAKKAGIFDPWRQEEEEAPKLSELDQRMLDLMGPRRLPLNVPFRGAKGGFTVRLPDSKVSDEEAFQDAYRRVVEACYEIHRFLPQVLTHHEVTLSKVDGEDAVQFTDGRRWVTIATGVKEGGPRRQRMAIGLLASAFRYAEKLEQDRVLKLLNGLGITHYIN